MMIVILKITVDAEILNNNHFSKKKKNKNHRCQIQANTNWHTDGQNFFSYKLKLFLSQSSYAIRSC